MLSFTIDEGYDFNHKENNYARELVVKKVTPSFKR